MRIHRTFVAMPLVGVAYALLAPAAALALSLNVGFSPARACPGDRVHLHIAIADLASANEKVMVTAVVTVAGSTYGPYTVDRTLEGQRSVQGDVIVHLPRSTPPGAVTLTVHAADTRGTTHGSARLSVCPRTKGKMDPEHLAKRIRAAIRELA